MSDSTYSEEKGYLHISVEYSKICVTSYYSLNAGADLSAFLVVVNVIKLCDSYTRLTSFPTESSCLLWKCIYFVDNPIRVLFIRCPVHLVNNVHSDNFVNRIHFLYMHKKEIFLKPIIYVLPSLGQCRINTVLVMYTSLI